MLLRHLLLLVLNLSVLKCASIDDNFGEKGVGVSERGEVVGDVTVEGGDVVKKVDAITYYLNEQLFHYILEFLAKSTGKMAILSVKMCRYVEVARSYRFYEGACWDMPEIANVWRFGIPGTPEMKALITETDPITSFRDVAHEQIFNQSIKDLLFKEKRFKKLAFPVLKYLVRSLYSGIASGRINDDDTEQRRGLLIFAVNKRFYDVFFEMSKDVSLHVFYQNNLIIDDTFYFGYFNWVFDNRPALAHVLRVLDRDSENETSAISDNEITGWAAVCIHRKAPEYYYINHLSHRPLFFLGVIQTYLFKFSLITPEADVYESERENDYYHNFINSLVDRYLRQTPSLIEYLPFAELLNDIRYGPEGTVTCEQCVTTISGTNANSIASCIMAASKANKKGLVQGLFNLPELIMSELEDYVDFKNPHSFKAYFDIIEGTLGYNPAKNIFDYTYGSVIYAITSNKFKIISTTFFPNSERFVIESAPEFVELGFASTYEFILENATVLTMFIQLLLGKMFNDAAESGAEEFEKFVTEHCGEHVIIRSVIHGQGFDVSYEVVELLLENERLIKLLQNHNVRLFNKDKRISNESIADFRAVINHGLY